VNFYRKHCLAGCMAIATTICVSPATAGSPGVFFDRIVVGQSAAFDGPTKALGLGMRAGLQAQGNRIK